MATPGAPTHSCVRQSIGGKAGPIRDLLEDDLESTDRQLEASLDIRSGDIRSLILRLGEEARHPGFASQMLA